jgi:hypothetical protein
MTEVGFNNQYYHLQNKMIDWCRDHIGPGGWLENPKNVWRIESAFGNTFFYFNNPEDATLFLLKWS